MERTSPSAWIALGVIVIVGACLHIARISYPATPVFDEVHFATDAGDYVNDKVFFDIHPPLGKLIFASVIPLVHSGPLDNATFIEPVPNTTTAQYQTTGLPYGTYPYVPLRLVGVFFGICLVIAFYFFLRSVGISEVGALLAVCFITFENAILLDTKLILMDGMYLAFGFAALAVWFRKSKRSGPIAGLLLGLSIGVKLMGVLFVLPILVESFLLERSERSQFYRSFLKAILTAILVFVLVVSSNFLFFSPTTIVNFFQSIGFHIPSPYNANTFTEAIYVNTLLPWTGYFVQDAGNAPGSSPWYGWPFMQKPMTYYSDPTNGNSLILTGNPVVWYASTLAVILALIAFLYYRGRSRWLTRAPLILLGGYILSFIPYILFIHRSTYLYHYFPALLLAVGILSWGLSRFLKLESVKSLSQNQWFMLTGIIALVVGGFLVAMPATYGFAQSPVSSSTSQQQYNLTLVEKQMLAPFTVNGIQYAVGSPKEIGTSLGKVKLGVGESKQGHFILAQFVARNPGSSTVTLNNIQIAMLDANGNSFAPVGPPAVTFTSTPGYEAYYNNAPQPITIAPGATVQLFMIVDVPTTARGLSFAISNLKDESYYVPLGL